MRSNVLVLSYNGVGVEFSQGLFRRRGWFHFKTDCHIYLADKQPETQDVSNLIADIDRKIDHVIIYTGSLRKLSWAKFAKVSFLKKFPDCTFTVFTCDCVNEHQVDQAAESLQLERWRFQRCSHIIGNEVQAWLNMYWSYGIEVFNFPSLDEYYQDYRVKNL